jgi:hypothetical protein
MGGIWRFFGRSFLASWRKEKLDILWVPIIEDPSLCNAVYAPLISS